MAYAVKTEIDTKIETGEPFDDVCKALQKKHAAPFFTWGKALVLLAAGGAIAGALGLLAPVMATIAGMGTIGSALIGTVKTGAWFGAAAGGAIAIAGMIAQRVLGGIGMFVGHLFGLKFANARPANAKKIVNMVRNENRLDIAFSADPINVIYSVSPNKEGNAVFTLALPSAQGQITEKNVIAIEAMGKDAEFIKQNQLAHAIKQERKEKTEWIKHDRFEAKTMRGSPIIHRGATQPVRQNAKKNLGTRSDSLHTPGDKNKKKI